MEGRIKPSPVLNAPPAKESDPFCTSATLLPLRPCRRNTFQKGEFPLHSHPPRARRNAASNRAFSFSQCAISARDLSSRASIWAWMSAAFFSCFRRAASKALCALATARCRRSRSFCWAASFARSARPGCVTRCSVRPILEVPRYPPFPCSPFDGLSNDRYRLRPSQRSQHLEWPLCARSGPSVIGACGRVGM